MVRIVRRVDIWFSRLVGFLIFSTVFFIACDSSIIDPNDNGEVISDTIIRVNKFIKEDMETYYLWSSELPSIDYKLQPDPFAYYDSLLYADDRWSFMTDDYEALSSSFEGTEKSFGYALAFGKFTNSDTYFAIVEYINSNTPAKKAGIQRGDIIVGFDGNDITKDNYMNLFYKESIVLNMGILGENGIGKGQDIALNGELLTIDPILMDSIYEVANRKIGYMVYNQFIGGFNDRISEVLQNFQTNGITDLVLDLRYNPGGGADAAQYLCSSLAPLTAVNGKSNIVTKRWNELLTNEWIKQDMPEQLYVNFDNTVPVKLGLGKIYVLTTSGTASASEFTIVGLSPYMDVVQIGEATAGKYSGSVTLRPMEYNAHTKNWDIVNMIANWAIQPIVFQYTNSVGLTGFSNGLEPDFTVADQLLPATMLGDLSEPLLAKAVEIITDGDVVASKSKRVDSAFTFDKFKSVSSRFQKFKETVRVDIGNQPSQ